VTRPAQTIGDTARGVGHIFGTARATMNATDPHGDRIIASVTGGASARRKQAFNLGVDPNTSFPPLADQLKRVATASAVGHTSANVGMSFVAGPAMQSVRAALLVRCVICSGTRRQRTSKRKDAICSPPWVFRKRQ
jgi:hypothetical protein